MSRYVWALTTKGGDAKAVDAAIAHGIDRLRAGDGGDLSPDECQYWQEDVSWVSVDTVAHDDGVSVLVDVDLFGQRDEYDRQVAAVLSGGFDEVICVEVSKVEGVTEVTHSDRIERPEEGQ